MAANGRGGPHAASAIDSCGGQAGSFLPARSAMAGKGGGGIVSSVVQCSGWVARVGLGKCVGG